MSSIIGLAGIVFGIWYVMTHHSQGFQGYFDTHAMILLGILPPCIMLLSHRLSDFGTGIQILLQAMFDNTRRQHRDVINSLTSCSAKVRAEGVGALVNERKKLTYELLTDGVSLIVNNFTADEIRHNLQAKINAKQGRMGLASNLFENMSKISPGVGMIGTLTGLIQMMSKISDPSTIASGMAMALVATLYGLLLGTIIYAPFGEKIAIEADKIHQLDLLVLEGVLALKDKKSSIHLRDIVKTYGKTPAPETGGKST